MEAQPSAKYKLISAFLVSNILKLNDDKTHLLLFTTSQARRQAGAAQDIQIQTSTETISPSSNENRLGAWIHQDLKWSECLQDNQENLIKSLSTRLGAIKMISRVSSFKTKKMTANGVFMSKLI